MTSVASNTSRRAGFWLVGDFLYALLSRQQFNFAVNRHVERCTSVDARTLRVLPQVLLGGLNQI